MPGRTLAQILEVEVAGRTLAQVVDHGRRGVVALEPSPTPSGVSAAAVLSLSASSVPRVPAAASLSLTGSLVAGIVTTSASITLTASAASTAANAMTLRQNALRSSAVLR